MRMPIHKVAVLFLGLAAISACGSTSHPADISAPENNAFELGSAFVFWNSATVYFLLTDRFYNGNPDNDHALGRGQDGAPLRTFQGGDLAGVLQKLEDGYFEALGVDAIWMTPWTEQIAGSVDEGTGKTYGYHGYWTRDWTGVEPALGTFEDLRAVVDAAHQRGIRVIMDAIINHTGPVTPNDPVWPEDWVRTSPRCAFQTYATTVDCTLVENLPDILTASNEPVELPPQLTAKWEEEGRLAEETAELDAFFARTGYPRAPRYYIIKWLTDWVRELGIDGYRMDTAKHFEEHVAAELKQEAELAFAEWKEAHPENVVDDLPFHMFGEVYGYHMINGRDYDFGDKTVDFFDYGYDGLINFDFKSRAKGPMDELFTLYSTMLHGGDLDGTTILNYASSHDDGSPLDGEREYPLGTGTRLLLAPGGAQIYYGDELARPLRAEGAEGDANLRSSISWENVEDGSRTSEILVHWQKLGRFRQTHRSVGSGEHRILQAEPYIFSRILETGGITDRVLVAMDQGEGAKTIPVFEVFPDGTELVDSYSQETGTVTNGAISLVTRFGLVLLSEKR